MFVFGGAHSRNGDSRVLSSTPPFPPPLLGQAPCLQGPRRRLDRRGPQGQIPLLPFSGSGGREKKSGNSELTHNARAANNTSCTLVLVTGSAREGGSILAHILDADQLTLVSCPLARNSMLSRLKITISAARSLNAVTSTSEMIKKATWKFRRHVGKYTKTWLKISWACRTPKMLF